MNKPSYVTKFPEAIQEQWTGLNNTLGIGAANKFLERIMVKTNEVAVAHYKEDTEIFTLSFAPREEQIVIHAEGDEEFIDFILTDAKSNRLGTSFDEDFLNELAEQINKNPMIGDFNHQEMTKYQKQGFGLQTIKDLMKGKSGVAKTVKALVENGKLFVRTIIDKRYRKRIKASKGVSIEGAFAKSASGKYSSGTVFGFSFVDGIHNPVNKGAKLLK